MIRKCGFNDDRFQIIMCCRVANLLIVYVGGSAEVKGAIPCQSVAPTSGPVLPSQLPWPVDNCMSAVVWAILCRSVEEALCVSSCMGQSMSVSGRGQSPMFRSTVNS